MSSNRTSIVATLSVRLTDFSPASCHGESGAIYPSTILHVSSIGANTRTDELPLIASIVIVLYYSLEPQRSNRTSYRTHDARQHSTERRRWPGPEPLQLGSRVPAGAASSSSEGDHGQAGSRLVYRWVGISTRGRRRGCVVLYVPVLTGTHSTADE